MRSFFKCILIVTAGFLPAVTVLGQDTLALKRNNRILLYSSAAYGAGLVGLNNLWYKGADRSALHSFNDNKEWLQMDKVGHGFSTYTLTKLSYHLYSKTDKKSSKQAILYSGISSFTFLTTIELLDGYSKRWGFSWGDFIANTGGIGLFMLQEQLFEKQIVQMKYSFRTTPYSELRPNVLGANLLEENFKDYNGQTYWLSANLYNIFPSIEPKWLSVSFGLGADAMVFGSERDTVFEGSRYEAERQYYLSLDVDWSKIKTKKEWVRWVFRVANCIKIPAPAIELKGGKTIKYHLLHF